MRKAAVRAANDAAAAGKRLADYLSKRAGVAVVPFVASSYGTLVRGFTEGWVDFGWLPPLVYVMASQSGKAEPLAKFVRLGKGSYHGAFIVRASSRFKTLQSLEGKRIAYTDPRSSAGYLFPRAHLRRLGLEPDAFFSQQAFLGSHKRVVGAVLDGRAEVGVTFFSPQEGREPGAAAWTQHFPVRAREIRVIAQTPAIPSDVIAARAGCPKDVAEKVRAAFIAMGDDPVGREILSSIFNAERAIPANASEYVEIERMIQTKPRKKP